MYFKAGNSKNTLSNYDLDESKVKLKKSSI